VECAPCTVHNYELHEKQFCLPDTKQNNSRWPLHRAARREREREGVGDEGDINSVQRLGHYPLQRQTVCNFSTHAGWLRI